MRALFSEYCDSVQDGTYILVAKSAILDTPFEEIRKQFTRALKKSKSI